MNPRKLYFFALIGFIFLWSALTAELALRYFKVDPYALENSTFVPFVALFVITTLGLVLSNFITFQILNRSTSTTAKDTKKTSSKNHQKKTKKKVSGKTSQTDKGENKSTTKESANKKRNKSATKGVSGRVKVYFRKSSYGFVEDDQGNRIFFHKTGFKTKVSDHALVQRPKVKFDVGKNERGLVANNIRIVE
ncbi:MAG: cold shock domain-containing protein [Gammaproteobacteria bacterium]|nr:cold shock domain-containing protein [Gammaproteobacteria bacterium]MDE0253015.1 cold shock domain-containing protein [Gammaproteobacteria bacterium]MDE0402341.1 cold shock domain-containing protein [Gammaproteobacteria bacterium]